MATLPYGSWPSPISAAAATRSGIRFTDAIRVDGADLYWLESQPHEGGRSALVRRDGAGRIADFGPADFDARTRVHEYGGAAYIPVGGAVYAARFDDQRWYRLEGNRADAITPPEEPGPRFADLTVGAGWAIAVQERHAPGGEPENSLARIDLGGGAAPAVVVSGHDFFAAPRLSPDQRRIAWLTWDHPNMPWDGTDLWVADIDATGLEVGTPTHIAGGPAESILQPEWGPDGALYFASDRTGWWNLYKFDSAVTPVLIDEAEYSQEMWNLGLRRFAFLGDGRLVVAKETVDGDRLVVVEPQPRELDLPFQSLGTSIATRGSSVFAVAAAFDRPTSVVRIDVDTGEVEVIRSPDGQPIDPGFTSIPEQIVFDTPDGPAHALCYPPQHPSHTGPANGAPPAIVNIHGGPTSRLSMGLDPERLFWTSRGFAIIDVDYGGSTGHGRAYRERLRGQWGVVDVRDCALAAAECAQRGLADASRLVIRGGSAGGFTVLAALAHRSEFAGGAARYAVTDLETLAADTHKFESRYLDTLVGPYPATRDRYIERSPITHCDIITAPVLLLQGSEDKVVPPSQAHAMRDRLLANGVQVEYIEFPGEAHGFRGAPARIRALEAELAFFGQVLGFDPHDGADGGSHE